MIILLYVYPTRGEAKTELYDIADPSRLAPTCTTLFQSVDIKPPALGTIIGTYKSTTARLINGIRRTPGEPVWQRNYYEHIIRNENELEIIKQYMIDNPIRWEEDSEHPV